VTAAQPTVPKWRTRVALITYTPPNSHGGVERQIQSALESARTDKGFDVSILRAASARSPFLLSVAELFLAQIRQRRFLLDQSVLDCQEFSGLPVIIFGKLRRKERPSFLVHCHGPLFRELTEMPAHKAPILTKSGRIVSHAILTVMEWISARGADIVACDSSDTLDIVCDKYGVPRGRCLTFPKGINPLVFHPEPSPALSPESGNLESRKFILFVGRVDPRKRVLELLQWFRGSTLYGETLLVLVGPRASGRYARQVDDLVRKAGPRIKRNVEISDSELNKLYAAAGCLVMASWSEGEGLVALEAIASGCPVVCPTTVAELLRRDFPGIELQRFDDWSVLSDAVGRAIATPIDQRRRNAEYLLTHGTREAEWRLLRDAWLRLARMR